MMNEDAVKLSVATLLNYGTHPVPPLTLYVQFLPHDEEYGTLVTHCGLVK